ncbi:hypothetical protein MMAD_29060 [Mycolicibacterium madagascariense]|uniref:Chitin-binding protein n=1 Tax=Mycolicibacterium madagascariense TaxID=212765 RepID=A0A7I7XHE0_9MYCO|nr:hypothetical protein [Mycolicibacterium madagascariense]MCV7011508.1 hypothetical protein [Mycolicibacterium madagascariense]BBZ28611.1 hypothetical protein MMAD_29060 [Mycolicibacterium madagascariense]
MKPAKLLASVAIAGGLAAGALGLSTGIASAAPGQAPIPVDWGHPHPGGPGWGGPGPVGWGPPPPPPPPYYGGYGGGPFPGGWNGGWEPNGGVCLGPFCV